MATAAEIKSFINQALPDNNTGEISEEVLRDTLTGLVDWTTQYNPTWVSRGAWSSATAYALNDYVTNNGSTYRCKAAHTNQAVTNTAFWELVAGRGTDGNAVVNRGGSLYNLITDTSIGATIDTASDVVPVAVFTHTNASQGWTSNLRIPVRLDRLYVLEFEVIKSVAGDLFFSLYTYNKVNSGLTGPYSTSANTTTWNKYSLIFGGPSGPNTARFTSDTVSVGFAMVSYIASTIRVKNLVIREIPLSEPIQHNLTLSIPDGQAVVHATNPKQRGIYINATEGIEWFTGREIVLTPNGTNVVFNIRRPYKFTWSVLNNDGVTIVSQPSATVNLNTDALITLTGTAGKTLTLNIQESI